MKYHELSLVGESTDWIIENEEHYWNIYNEVISFIVGATTVCQEYDPLDEHRAYLRLPIVFEGEL